MGDRSTRMATAASSQLHMPSAADVRDNAAWKAFKPLVTGAMAGMVATTCTQPLDTLKVRVQVAAASGKSVSPFTVASQTVRNEGALVFYKGLTAGLRLWAGFPTYYAKMAPQVGIALIMQDQIKGMWRAMGVRCGYGIPDAQTCTDVLVQCS